MSTKTFETTDGTKVVAHIYTGLFGDLEPLVDISAQGAGSATYNVAVLLEMRHPAPNLDINARCIIDSVTVDEIRDWLFETTSK